MRLLMDTHTFIWWDSEPQRLSPHAMDLLSAPENQLLLSVVSVWEIQIKRQLGKLSLSLPLAELIHTQQQFNQLEVILVSLEHVLALDDLPLHHNDPFDRLLIAQAIIEQIPLVSRDQFVSQYPAQVLW
ncbi:MAG: type II toxin-antitoxin system VapC family toxin [Elainellaceae cyanobacterium]